MAQKYFCRLKERRRFLQLSQEELADDIGVHRVTIARIEAGTIKPSLSVALQLARSLACTVEKLFYFADENDMNEKLRSGIEKMLPKYQPSRGRRAAEYWTEILREAENDERKTPT